MEKKRLIQLKCEWNSEQKSAFNQLDLIAVLKCYNADYNTD